MITNQLLYQLSYTGIILFNFWLGIQDSNLEPAVPKTDALPIELIPNVGDLYRDRTGVLLRDRQTY